ncbi:MAG TPA: sugar phosphate isomerase/epimerase family protein [Methylomirabilota bacterium]|nr:sugar phosphate isomerase/epimerase family protein [Methylomirabilota bacterium]
MSVRGLALHTWTLDTTPLPAALAVVRAAGWGAVELRRIDFERAREAGRTPEQVMAEVRASGLAVACVGARFGWMWEDRVEERTTLLGALDDAARWAAALGCATVMSPVDRGRGDTRRAAASVREAGDVVAAHGVTLAVEPNSQCEQLNTIERVREVLALAGHPRCGLLVDTYHVQRAGDWRALEDLPRGEIAYVQYSDVPRETRPGFALDRLPPGRGVVPFREAFALVAASGYSGWLSYEAPNEAAWKRPPDEVAREALEASRPLLPQ